MFKESMKLTFMTLCCIAGLIGFIVGMGLGAYYLSSLIGEILTIILMILIITFVISFLSTWILNR